MAEKPNPNPEEKGKVGDEETLTPLPPKEGTEEEPTSKKTTPEGGGLTPEEDLELKEFRELKTKTGFKKFSESATEAIRLANENKELKVKLAEKASETPSAEEMATKYPDWDMLTETEKILLIRQEKTEKALAEVLKDKEWQNNFYKAKTAFPELPEEEFKEFCSKHPNTDVEVLAKSFLFDKNPPEPAKPRKGLEKPTGGSKMPVPEGWTVEEIKRLRTTDEKKYIELIRKGIIKSKEIRE